MDKQEDAADDYAQEEEEEVKAEKAADMLISARVRFED